MQRHLYEHFNLPGHSEFSNDVSSHLLIRHTLKILLNEKISGFRPLKPKLHQYSTLKMVFRSNSLYFAPLIIFMDGLFLDNDFRTRFPYFIISIAVVSVSLLQLFFGFVILLLFYYIVLSLSLLLLLLLLLLILLLYIH